jgi:NAD(P)-dependent dehydrogenase (short-subunit alcohol dehydrogenase family)
LGLLEIRLLSLVLSLRLLLLCPAQLLINNAGIYGRRGNLVDFEATDFQAVFNANAVGPFLVVQNLLKQGLLGPPGSTVVNITSIMASHGDPTISSVTPGGYAYRCEPGPSEGRDWGQHLSLTSTTGERTPGEVKRAAAQRLYSCQTTRQ